MTSSPEGIYLPDGTFRSRDEVLADLATRDTKFTFKDPPKLPEDRFDWWHDRVTIAQEARQEALGIPEHVEVDMQSNAPIILALIGDVHAGSQDVAYDMFYHDVQVIKEHPQAYTLLFGDLTDCYFFTPAVHEHLINLQEQMAYMRAACDEMNGKILAAWPGNHELWASRMGPTMYYGWVERYNTHYLEGVSYVTLNLNGRAYKIVGSHAHRGYSVYNDSHASRRQVLDDAETADASVTAHKHIKANAMQYTKMHGGEARPVHYISLGSYCPSTTYSRVRGWHNKAEEQMGGTYMVLHHDRKHIEVFQTIDEAAERVAPYLV